MPNARSHMINLRFTRSLLTAGGYCLAGLRYFAVESLRVTQTKFFRAGMESRASS